MDSFKTIQNNKKKLGVPQKHLPQINFPLDFTTKDLNKIKGAIVLIHGAFESPYFFQGMAEFLSHEGYVVIRPLLTGHWESSFSSLSKTKYTDWESDVEQAMLVAQCFSKNISFVGHSLGGLLALDLYLAHSAQIKSLVFLTPAFELNRLPQFIGAWGSLLKLQGNQFLNLTPDQDETPFYSPEVVIQMEKLKFNLIRKYKEEDLLSEITGELNPDYGLTLSSVNIYRLIQVPSLLIVAENDPAISHFEENAFYQQSSAAVQKIEFPLRTNVWHGNIGKSSKDVYKKYPSDYNFYFEPMMRKIGHFLNVN